MSRNPLFRCPACDTIVATGDENFPFCSDRCKLIDLGKWASGVYRISSPDLDPEVLEGIEPGQKSAQRDDEE